MAGLLRVSSPSWALPPCLRTAAAVHPLHHRVCLRRIPSFRGPAPVVPSAQSPKQRAPSLSIATSQQAGPFGATSGLIRSQSLRCPPTAAPPPGAVNPLPRKFWTKRYELCPSSTPRPSPAFSTASSSHLGLPVGSLDTCSHPTDLLRPETQSIRSGHVTFHATAFGRRDMDPNAGDGHGELAYADTRALKSPLALGPDQHMGEENSGVNTPAEEEPSGQIPTLGEGSSGPKAHMGEECSVRKLVRVERRGAIGSGAELDRMAETRPELAAVVVDFDCTCTEKDTTELLHGAAIDALRGPGGGGFRDADAEERAAEIARRWEELVEWYGARMESAMREAFEASQPPMPSFDPAGLRAFLHRLSSAEMDAVDHVQASQVLAGIPRASLQALRAGDEGVPLRTGCVEFLQRVARLGARVHVVSVNLSRDVIMAVLPTLEESGGLTIHCNDLNFVNGISDGSIRSAIHTPLDKEIAMLSILSAYRSGNASQPEGPCIPTSIPPTHGSISCTDGSFYGKGHGTPTATPFRLSMYLGDSITDLLPLLQADVGIVVGHSSLLHKVAAHFGVQLRPITEAAVGMSRRGEGVLYTAESFAEIDGLLEAWSNPLDGGGAAGPPAQSGAGAFGHCDAAVSGGAGASARVQRSHGQEDRPGGREALAQQCVSDERLGRGQGSELGVMGWGRHSNHILFGREPTPFAEAVRGVRMPVAAGCRLAPVASGGRLGSGQGLGKVTLGKIRGGELRAVSTRTQAAVDVAGVRVGEAAQAPAPPPCVLTVAGSDSGGGAGIQADLKVYGALGVYGMSVVTAVTAQNTAGVQGVHAIPDSFVAAQMDSVLADIGADVIKTGMLPSAAVIRTVAAKVRALRDRCGAAVVVVDPVLVATSGDALALEDTVEALRTELLPLATIVTPNLPEAAAVLRLADGDKIDGVEGMREAARALHALGAGAVLLKGGHASWQQETSLDILYDGTTFHELASPRITTRNTHGTGCSLASAIAACLARGLPLLDAVTSAKGYVTQALRESAWLDIGKGRQGPLNHFFATTQWAPSLASPRARFRPSDLLLYAVTDSRMNRRWGRSNADAIRGAIEGGATFLQLREKDMDTGDFVREARAVVNIARDAGIPLVINDRIDVALAAGADGVHIGQSDMPIELARSLLGPDRIVGVSAKTPEQAQRALCGGADYLGTGGVYPTTTKADNPTIGLKGLATVCGSTRLPIVAIGGIKTANAAEVMAGHGASGIAIVSAVFDQPDVAAATRKLRALLDQPQEEAA